MVKSGAVETLQAVVIGSLFNQLQHFLNLEIHCCDLNGRRREKKQNHHYYLHGIIMKQLLIKQVKCRLEAESKHRVKLLSDRSVKRLAGGRTTSAAIPSQWNTANPSEKQKTHRVGKKEKTRLAARQSARRLPASQEAE